MTSKERLKNRVWQIIFEAETKEGKLFDVVLLWLIFFSILAVCLESISAIEVKYGTLLIAIEWLFTILFTLEYAARLWVSRRPLRYATSFYGIIDLISCIPTYLALFFINSNGFAVIRVLRLLRIFRILKMAQHVRGATVLINGLRKSRAKITVFFFAVLVLSVIAGTMMYFVEGGQPNTKFTSIPMGIYYAIVSISTVGYGDIVATTVLGKFLTTLLILAGYAIIAVPTGIVSSALVKADNEPDVTTDACPGCGANGHLLDAKFCRKCGEDLSKKNEPSLEKSESS